MPNISDEERALLERVCTELGGRFVPEDPASTVLAVRLLQAGYLADDPRNEDGFVLTPLARDHLRILQV